MCDPVSHFTLLSTRITPNALPNPPRHRFKRFLRNYIHEGAALARRRVTTPVVRLEVLRPRLHKDHRLRACAFYLGSICLIGVLPGVLVWFYLFDLCSARCFIRDHRVNF